MVAILALAFSRVAGVIHSSLPTRSSKAFRMFFTISCTSARDAAGKYSFT
jgi:hypothetical protein